MKLIQVEYEPLPAVTWVLDAMKDDAPLVLFDVTLFLLLGGLFAALIFRNLGKVSLIPTGDPRLPESMSFENA